MTPIEPVAVVDYAARRGYGVERPPSRTGRVALQVAHRSLSMGLILLTAGAGLTAAGKTAAPLLLWAFAAGDVAVLGAFLSLASERRRGRPGRESLVTACVAAGVVLVALVTFAVTRVFRGA